MRYLFVLSLGLVIGVRSALAEPLTFAKIAQDFVDGVPFLKAGVPIPISDDGHIAFPVVDHLNAFRDGLRGYHAGGLTDIDLVPGDYDQISSVAVANGGHVAFVASRGDSFRGVYRTTTAGAPISTYHETQPAVEMGAAARFVAMSGNGTTAFSTIVNGQGAVRRGPITGTSEVLRSGSGTFFNTVALDVNNAGSVPIQMEYFSPVSGLDRAILVFDTFDQPLGSSRSAIEQSGIGNQTIPSINSAGQVAFATNVTVTMNFYNPVNNSTGALVESITLLPGVYVTEPVAVGQVPRTFTQIANTAGTFNSFSKVRINDSGQIVFQATLDPVDGFSATGIFTGGDPVADGVVKQGDVLEDGHILSIVELGDLNNTGVFTMFTSQFGGDQQIWIAGPAEAVAAIVPEPAGLLLLLAGLPLRRHRRAAGA